MAWRRVRVVSLSRLSRARLTRALGRAGACCIGLGVAFSCRARYLDLDPSNGAAGGSAADARASDAGLSDAGPSALRPADAARDAGPSDVCDPNAGCLSPCELGDNRCNLGALETCASDRSRWVEVERCATSTLCEVGLSGSAESPPANRCAAPVCDSCRVSGFCSAGMDECRDTLCTPGEWRCNFERLERCTTTPLEWRLVQTCVSALECNLALSNPSVEPVDILNPCPTQVCVPLELRCQGPALMQCNTTLTELELVQVCATQEACEASMIASAGSPEPRCVEP